MSGTVCVGAIAGAFGVKGEVRLKSFTATPEDIAAYGALLSEDGARSFEVTLTGQTTGALTARLSGLTTREQAEALRGTRLVVPRARLPALPEDEFYHADLVGLEVFDTGGARCWVRCARCSTTAPRTCWRSRRRARAARCSCRSPARRCRPSIWPPGASWPIRPTGYSERMSDTAKSHGARASAPRGTPAT